MLNSCKIITGYNNWHHDRCVVYGGVAGAIHIDYVRGANIAGFKKVADAMLAYGVV